jgi:hypothetical protein
MAFFDSEIVQTEARSLFNDYQNLIQLGSNYGKFDREGKKLFIEQMEEVLDRYAIFMKRMELSDDFMAQMNLKQLQTHLGNFGTTPQAMFGQMRLSLEQMKKEIDK